MKTYLRLISYARPFGRFVTPLLVFSPPGVLFALDLPEQHARLPR